MGVGSLVGSHLAAALLARNVGEVVVYDPIAFDAEDALGDLKDDPRITMVRGDLMKLHQTIDHMKGIDGAVNLAGSILLKPAHLTKPEEYDETIDELLEKKLRGATDYPSKQKAKEALIRKGFEPEVVAGRIRDYHP